MHIRSGRARDAYRVPALAILVAGGALRVWQYARQPSLSIDEARLALNLGTRSLWGLTRPLDHNQVAPILFLWGEWIAAHVGGFSEYALRAIPLLSGLALLPLLWRVGGTLLGQREGMLASLFAAVSAILIFYGNQVKPYGVDALVTVAMLGLAASVLRAPRSGRAWGALAGGGALAVLLSVPSVFVLVGVMAALVTDPAVYADRVVRRRAVAVAATYMGAYLARFVIADSHAGADRYLQHFWQHAFLTPGASDYGTRLRSVLHHALVDPFFFSTVSGQPHPVRGVVLLVLFMIGCAVVIRRRGRSTALMLLGPYVATAVAMVAGQYPGGARLLLFLSPILFLLCAAALIAVADAAARVLERRGVSVRARRLAPQAAGYASLVVLTLAWTDPRAAPSIWHLLPPDRRGDLVRDIARGDDRDPVYVMASEVPDWFFYTTEWRKPDTARLAWMAPLASSGGPAFENAPSRGRAVSVGSEGRDLVNVDRGRLELLGLATGSEVWADQIEQTRQADTGWSGNEAARIRSVAYPGLWILADRTQVYASEPLLRAVRACGGAVDHERVLANAVAYHVRFSPESPRNWPCQ